MPELISDDLIRHLANDALHLYHGFDEVYRPLLVEAVLCQLPPDFDRKRVERILAEMVPYQS
jgi:uncharacterized protein YecE (DUF72 family)